MNLALIAVSGHLLVQAVRRVLTRALVLDLVSTVVQVSTAAVAALRLVPRVLQEPIILTVASRSAIYVPQVPTIILLARTLRWHAIYVKGVPLILESGSRLVVNAMLVPSLAVDR